MEKLSAFVSWHLENRNCFIYNEFCCVSLLTSGAQWESENMFWKSHSSQQVNWWPLGVTVVVSKRRLQCLTDSCARCVIILEQQHTAPDKNPPPTIHELHRWINESWWYNHKPSSEGIFDTFSLKRDILEDLIFEDGCFVFHSFQTVPDYFPYGVWVKINFQHSFILRAWVIFCLHHFMPTPAFEINFVLINLFIC